MDDVLGYAGTRAVVSGAASGMGEAVARILVDLGAEVIGLDLKPTSVPVARSIRIDLRDPVSIAEAVREVGEPVHSVAACAGLPGPPFSELDTLLVNFVGTRQLVEGLAGPMPAGGAITWVASNAGLGWQGQLALLTELVDTDGFDAGRVWCEERLDSIASGYMLSKQAINAYVASRAGAFAEKGLRINCTNPGPTATPMMPYFHESAGKDLVDAALGPIHRYSTPEEQAWPIVFLGSPRAGYVTGESLMVDGGFFGALQTGQIDFSQVLGG
jgi:NAD(P)-dependent dehydrogenase (short-subunit alcohol dehydrogenase family)